MPAVDTWHTSCTPPVSARSQRQGPWNTPRSLAIHATRCGIAGRAVQRTIGGDLAAYLHQHLSVTASDRQQVPALLTCPPIADDPIGNATRGDLSALDLSDGKRVMRE